MKQLFLFECKKVMKRKSIWIAFLLPIVAAIAMYIFNYSVANQIQQGNITRLQNNITNFGNFIKESETELEEAKKSGKNDAIEAAYAKVEHFKSSKKKYENMKENFIHEDWENIYRKEIPELKLWVDNYDRESRGFKNQSISQFTARATLEEKQWMEREDVQPFIQNTVDTWYLPTIYDSFMGSDLQQWKNQTKRYGMTGLAFLYQMIQYFYIPAIILLGCFIFGNSVSSETDKKNRGLYFYFALPIQRTKLFIAKFLSGLTFMLGFVLFMLGVPLLCSLFTKGIGSFNYPVLFYEGAKPNPFGSEFNALNPSQDQFHFIYLKDYLWQASLFTLVLVIFLYSIYYILSLFMKGPSIKIIIMGFVAFIGLKASSSPYNPFTYFDIHRVLTGETATMAFNSSINFLNGVLLFIFLIIVIECLLTLWGFKRFNKGIS